MPELLTESRATTGAVDQGAGLFRVRIIDEGLGSSGYYPAETIKKAVERRVWAKGQHVYLDHPSATETMDRPERSIRDLAGVLDSDAVWNEEAKAAEATVKVNSMYRPLLTDMAPDIGMSIRAYAEATDGEVKTESNGTFRGPIVTNITEGISVDFVTHAGRGGAVLEVLESARRDAAHIIQTSEGEVTVLPVRTDPHRGRIYELSEATLATLPHSNPATPAGGATHTTTNQEAVMPTTDTERQLAESASRVTALETERDTAAQRATEAETKIAQLEAQLTESRKELASLRIAKALAESELPEAAQERVKADLDKQAADGSEVTDQAVADAIKAEKDYADKLAESITPRKLGNGTLAEATTTRRTNAWGAPIRKEA